MIPEFNFFALLLFRLAGLLRLALGLALPAAVSRRRRSLAPLIGGLLRILRPAVLNSVAGHIAKSAFDAAATTILLFISPAIAAVAPAAAARLLVLAAASIMAPGGIAAFALAEKALLSRTTILKTAVLNNMAFQTAVVTFHFAAIGTGTIALAAAILAAALEALAATVGRAGLVDSRSCYCAAAGRP